ncbi:MAG TPA: DUF3823 domain-containing protein [Bacteroidales bacterium]|nr:DUF3823 domain-containing protein [Balneolales bacterium]HYX05962.1 DUF3823 domain-containing protein [Bacteroidales bacterium]
MKRLVNKFYIVLAMLIMFTACKIDNYSAPKTMLTGKVVYKGQPIHVRSDAVQLELWQPGYQLKKYIPVYVDPSGTFSAKLFNGKYKLIPRAGDGPWETITDTTKFTLTGNKKMTVNVTPYFMLKNVNISESSTAIKSTFSINQIVKSAKLQRVDLYIANTHFDNSNFHIAKTEKSGSQISNLSSPITLSFQLSNIPKDVRNPNRDSVYVRVGVQTAGVPDMIYSKVKEVSAK